jgi:hypothetical protein
MGARSSLSRLWTPEDDERLKSMILAGRTPAEIAIKLRRSVAAVYARAHRFRLSFKRVIKNQFPRLGKFGARKPLGRRSITR